MDSSHPLYDLLCDDCNEAFERIRGGLPRVLKPHRPLPSLGFRLRQKSQFNARVRQPGNDARKAVIEVNTGVLKAVYHSIEASADIVVQCVVGGESDDFVDRDLLLSVVYDVSLHFVLLHEMYHIYEGHMAFLHSRKRSAVLNEVARCFRGDDGDLDAETAYFLEFEADGSARVSLLIHVEFEALVDVVTALAPLEDDVVMVQDFPETARPIGFRLILCAAWIVASLMEANRHRHENGVLPKARILSLLSNLMSWYAQLDNMTQNAEGELIQSLTDNQAREMREFIQQVAKPVLTQPWQLYSEQSDVRTPVRYNTTDIEQIARDLQTLLFRSSADTPASQQIVACERLRSTVEPLLDQHRYIHPN